MPPDAEPPPHAAITTTAATARNDFANDRIIINSSVSAGDCQLTDDAKSADRAIERVCFYGRGQNTLFNARAYRPGVVAETALNCLWK